MLSLAIVEMFCSLYVKRILLASKYILCMHPKRGTDGRVAALDCEQERPDRAGLRGISRERGHPIPKGFLLLLFRL